MKWEGVPKNIDKYQGFCYEITNLKNNRKYIGKKFFWKKKTLKPLKGRKNKRHVVVESDWREYYGSCNELLRDVKTYGKRFFKRKIIRLCESRWDCAYHEARIQFEKEVLFSKVYYNGIINVRLRSNKGD